jgi:hypothetical protein
LIRRSFCSLRVHHISPPVTTIKNSYVNYKYLGLNNKIKTRKFYEKIKAAYFKYTSTKNFREKRISETSLFAAVPKFEQEINLGREISEIE